MSVNESVKLAMSHLHRALDTMETYGVDIYEDKKGNGILKAIATLEDEVIGDY